MTSERQLPLFGGDGAAPPRPDRAAAPLPDARARAFAADPANNVVLEASAGTGKTTVLVSRYVNLLRAGVDPSNILAITFTRQAAAEMRDRIVGRLRRAADGPPAERRLWRTLHDRLGDIAVSTIDAFCLSLLREFPLEADLDPGFEMIDGTEAPRLVQQALDSALAICGRTAEGDPAVAMVLARLGAGRVRAALAHLLERRLAAPAAFQRFLRAGPRGLTGEGVCRAAARRLAQVLAGVDGGLDPFLADGPAAHPRFRALARELPGLASGAESAAPEALRLVLDRVRDYFLTAAGQPRQRFAPYRAGQCRSPAAWRRHCALARTLTRAVAEALAALDRDLNVVLARGVQRIFAVAVTEYERELAARSTLDFSGVLDRALGLLRRMDEFAQSRYRLESRYHHVLVDEFQDTSRAQWELVHLLVRSWGEGLGLVHEAPLPPSVFVVGDRKQSIYGFRDAEAGVIDDAAKAIRALRPGGRVRRSISHSFRAVPALLAFVNDLFGAVEKTERPRDGFRYDAADRFPVPEAPRPIAALGPPAAGDAPLGLVLAGNVEACAGRVAGEVVRLLDGTRVRDRGDGTPRPAAPGDVAILFRSRATHREFEAALEARRVPACVYKGLGFFDADEIKDCRALLRFLADPASELRAAALLRSRLVGLTDRTLAALAGRLAESVRAAGPAPGLEGIDPLDRDLLLHLQQSAPRWLAAVDRTPPAELVDRVLADCAYAFEMQGPRRVQARENLKKLRGLVRRVQNRGFATVGRIAEHLDRLSGDVSNAVVDAFDAVNLMTVHAAKGLEFPVVFLVELARGAGGPPPPVRVVADPGDGEPAVSVAPFRSGADRDRRDREREESKRLLYVAATRARDRLYLSATLADGGAVEAGAGSLAEVMPPALLEQLAAGAAGGRPAMWTGPSGRRHVFAAVGPAPDGASFRPPGTAAPAAPDRLGPWRPAGAAPRVAVAALAEAGAPAPDRDVDPVVGRLVQRLLQDDGEGVEPAGGKDPRNDGEGVEPAGGKDPRNDGEGVEPAGGAPDSPGQGVGPAAGAPDLRDRVLTLMEPDERARADVGALADEAADLYRRAVRRADIAALVEGGCLFEVPFTLRRPGPGGAARPVFVRGAIDCLHRRPDGGVTVVEIKTGAARPEHAAQLEICVEAARALFPGRVVDGRLLYLT